MMALRCVVLLALAAPCAALVPAALRARPPAARARPALAALSGPRAFLGEAAVPPPPEAIIKAVEAAGGAVTAADAAATGFVDLESAKRGLTELAGALAGADGVSVACSKSGDLTYAFPADVRGELASRSSAAKAREAWNGVKPGLQSAGRVAFGLALLASIAVVFTAIAVLQSESRGGDDRDERRGGRGGGGFGGGLGGFYSPFWSPLDLFFPRPYFGYYSYGWLAPPPQMNLPEAIFSFVFGDGDPNAALRAARVRGMAGAIRASGGAVVAEQLAPFLDPPARPPSTSEALVDESWVLPAVGQLGGRPEVADDGTIVYVFDELKVSAVASDANVLLADPTLASLDELGAPELAELARERGVAVRSTDERSLRAALRAWADGELGSGGGGGGVFPRGYLEERTAPFSNAEGGQLFAAAALGALNLGGVAYLGSLLSGLPPGAILPDWLGLVQTLFPALGLYAAAYVAIPAARFAKLGVDNAAVEQRNGARKVWADALRGGGSARRLEAAQRRGGKMRIVRADDAAYDSALDLSEQPTGEGTARDREIDDFDKRLRERK